MLVRAKGRFDNAGKFSSTEDTYLQLGNCEKIGNTKAGGQLTLDADIKDVNQVFHHQGPFSQTSGKGGINVVTPEDVTIDRDITGEGGVGIIAPNIDVMGQIDTSNYVLLQATGGHINIGADMSSKTLVFDAKGTFNNVAAKIIGINVGISAAEVNNLSRGSEQYRNFIRTSGQNINPNFHWGSTDGGIVQGYDEYIQSRSGNINNYGGTLQGTHYLQLKAAEDILNQCNTRYVQGKYDTIWYFDQARIIGGSGVEYTETNPETGQLETRNLGLSMSSGGKVINNASYIGSVGDNFIQANKGCQHRARYQQYVSKNKTKSTW